MFLLRVKMKVLNEIINKLLSNSNNNLVFNLKIKVCSCILMAKLIAKAYIVFVFIKL